MNSKSVVEIAREGMDIIASDGRRHSWQVLADDYEALCLTILQIDELAQKSSHAALAAIREILK